MLRASLPHLPAATFPGVGAREGEVSMGAGEGAWPAARGFYLQQGLWAHIPWGEAESKP